MRAIGELCLLTALIGSGFAAYIQLSDGGRGPKLLRTVGHCATWWGFVALTVVTAILAWALYCRDFSYAYVAQYSSELLPWYYSVSALWVGQAGSLLLWAWLLSLLIVLWRVWPQEPASPLRGPASGILLACLCFLLAVMVFAADPMEVSHTGTRDGAGLSPLLQHPAMLIHPPIVFLGYALWTVPFALAVAALWHDDLGLQWIRLARPWALMAWVVLGVGILLGAVWAYEELGWGGYWAWDPVENGSLLPWLTGTALIHCLMAWQHRGMLKRSAAILALVTFGLSNFATFLTRSGLFSSLHAFSQSPIGWLFLGLMGLVCVGGSILLVLRWKSLAATRSIVSVMSRESGVVVGLLALLLLSAVVLAGTISSGLSALITGETVLVGPAFYNSVMIPTGLVLLLVTAAAPLLRWGGAPTPRQVRALFASGLVGLVGSVAAWSMGVSHLIALAVAGLATFAVAALGSSLVVELRGWPGRRLIPTIAVTLRRQRRQYAGFVIHLGFVCLAIGIAGSSLGKREQRFVMQQGETVQWADRQIRLVRFWQRQLPHVMIGEAELEITDRGGKTVTLRPAQHFHRLAESYTTEVAIASSWRGDFYTILHSGGSSGELYLTFVENPLMRCLWLGGWITVGGVGLRLWPVPRRRSKRRTTRHCGRSTADSFGPGRTRRAA